MAEKAPFHTRTSDLSVMVVTPHAAPRQLINVVPQSSSLHCCCGRPDCDLLRQNCTVLETVERDVHTAAQLGQALLARHEAYMAGAESDRIELTARIEKLEMEKKELEAENAKTIEENRLLLDQLELLNSSIMDSDTRIHSLEACLQSSQQTIRRLEVAASRAENMERHISVLELEQLKLRNTLTTSEVEAKSAIQRWRKAERGIHELQEQIERMETEAQDEKERHVEVLDRMERQREMEKELNTAAGRLKGAAAAKSLQNGKNGSSVVSHFVRDLLADNANLQLGIAELREMLLNSHDEIQALREQVLFHQPVEGDSSAASTLRAELEPPQETQPTKVSQEVHIHHHYHVSPKAESKKPKKKRHGLSPGVFTPPVLSPTAPGGHWRLSPSAVAPALLSHSHRDSTSTLSGPSHRWSVFSEQPSEFAPSSVPSSPQSRRNSMFEPGFAIAVPTSPSTSVDPMSPTVRISHRKRASEVSTRSFQTSAPQHPMQLHQPASQQQHLLANPIHEEIPSVEDDPPDPITTDGSTNGDSVIPKDDSVEDEYHVQPRPCLRRAMSHESIMSLTGGLDIHTLKSRPSQLTLRPLGGAGAVLTGMTACATISRGSDKRTSVVLRDNLAGLPIPRMVSTPAISPSSPKESISEQNSGSFRGWRVWRPWGGASPSPSPKPEIGRGKDREEWRRAPGINQPGSIPGFQVRRGAPSKVLPAEVNRDALREGLEG